MQHFIIKNARRYKESTTSLTPSNADYCDKLGYWRDSRSGSVAVDNPEFAGLNTKKADMETGEDQKGE